MSIDDQMSEKDAIFMEEALKLAREAAAIGEVPIGAVVIHDGVIVGRGSNRREIDKDPTAHAALLAIKEARETLGRWRLNGCTGYVTLEPCVMCAGLMVNSRIDRCVYGASDPKGGAIGTLYDLSSDARLNHGFACTPGVLGEECGILLSDFFRSLRNHRNRP